MLSLYLVRHGHTEHSAGGGYCGSACRAALSETGHAMARAIADHLGHQTFAALYASPQLRARQTAEPLASKLGLTPVEEPALRELDYGAWEGKTPTELSDNAEYEAWLDNPADLAPPGGETARQVAARVVPLVDRIRARHPTGAVVLFSHKSTIRILACHLLDIELAQYRDRIPQPLASTTLLEAGESTVRASVVGDIAYLPAPLRDAAL